jgi:cytochrome c biogenesis protein CcmG/thiol:disulfide interchange protein DsbE
MTAVVPRRLPRALAALPLVIACAHATSEGPAPPSSPSPLLGAPLPTFRRPTVQGPVFDTAATPAGRVLVVDFFAAYCRPCQRALPALEALHAAHPDVAVVGVSMDDGLEGAAAMVSRHHLTFPVVHDGGHVLAGRFRVTELPSSFVADADGRHIVVWFGGPEQPEGAAALARAVTAVASAPREKLRQ